MPPRTRRAAAPAEPRLVLGFVGMEDLGAEIVEAQISDLMSNVTEGTKIEVVFPLVNDSVGDGLWIAFDALGEVDGLNFVAVTNPAGSDDDKQLAAEAAKVNARILPLGDDKPAVTVADELVKAASEGAEAKLIIFYIADDDPAVDTGAQYAAAETAINGGVKAYNICDGLDDIILGTTEEAAAATPEPPAPPARRSRRATTTEEPAATDPTAGDATEAPATSRRSRGKAADPAVDEAQAELPIQSSAAPLSDDAVGEILDAFASIIARKVVEKLREAAGEEEKPTRRTRG